MKKTISVILIFLLIFTLVSCSKDKAQNQEVVDKSGDTDDYGGEPVSAFSGIIIEISDNSILVEPDAESNEAKSADKISVALNDIELNAKVGDRVAVMYEGGIAESYPAQISGTVSVDVVFNWGITLTAQNISRESITIVCTQKGGEDVAELLTGSYYIIEKKTENGWEECPYIIDGNIGWESMGYLVNMNGRTYYEENWSWLYGALENGQYRIGKDFLNLREPGDYDQTRFYAEFEITDDTAQTAIDLVIRD